VIVGTELALFPDNEAGRDAEPEAAPLTERDWESATLASTEPEIEMEPDAEPEVVMEFDPELEVEMEFELELDGLEQNLKTLLWL